MASCQYCLLADSRSECKVAMWSLAILNIVRGLMGAAGSLAAGSTLEASCLGLAALAAALGAAGVGGGGGGVGGSSMMRVLGFLGALSLAPAGRPRFFGSGLASSLGAFSAIVASFSGTSSLSSICSATCLYKGKSARHSTELSQSSTSWEGWSGDCSSCRAPESPIVAC